MQGMKLFKIQKFQNLVFVMTILLAYILVKCDTVTPAPVTQIGLKNYAPFTKCITKLMKQH